MQLSRAEKNFTVLKRPIWNQFEHFREKYSSNISEIIDNIKIIFKRIKGLVSENPSAVNVLTSAKNC